MDDRYPFAQWSKAQIAEIIAQRERCKTMHSIMESIHSEKLEPWNDNGSQHRMTDEERQIRRLRGDFMGNV